MYNACRMHELVQFYSQLLHEAASLRSFLDPEKDKRDLAFFEQKIREFESYINTRASGQIFNGLRGQMDNLISSGANKYLNMDEITYTEAFPLPNFHDAAEILRVLSGGGKLNVDLAPLYVENRIPFVDFCNLANVSFDTELMNNIRYHPVFYTPSENPLQRVFEQEGVDDDLMGRLAKLPSFQNFGTRPYIAWYNSRAGLPEEIVIEENGGYGYRLRRINAVEAINLAIQVQSKIQSDHEFLINLYRKDYSKRFETGYIDKPESLDLVIARGKQPVLRFQKEYIDHGFN